MKILEDIKYWWNVYRHLKNGKHFTRKTKRIILKMIKLSRLEYKEGKPIYRGLCIILDSSEFEITHNYFCIITKELSIYHNPKYYESQGLKVERDYGYWWDRKDRESRLKALDILENAVIND